MVKTLTFAHRLLSAQINIFTSRDEAAGHDGGGKKKKKVTYG